MFELTKILISRFPEAFVKVDPHCEEDGWEDDDQLWLEYTPDDELSEGEYISIYKLKEDGSLWGCSHEGAHNFGGHPTFWSEYGTEEKLINKIVPHLKDLVK